MTDDGHHAMILRAGANPALVPSGSPLVARTLSELAPEKRRVLIVDEDVGRCQLLCDAVRAAGCLPLVAQEWSRASDLTNGLPFEVVILMGKSLEFLKEARASFPLEVPIVCGGPSFCWSPNFGEAYQGAIDAGAAFFLLDSLEELESTRAVIERALVLARFLRDHPEECGWPAPPPEDPGAYKFLVLLYEPDRDYDRLARVPSLLGYRTQVIGNDEESARHYQAEPPDVLWSFHQHYMRKFLGWIDKHLTSDVPVLASIWGAYSIFGPRKNVSDAVRWVGEWIVDIRQAASACHDAVRLRRAFQYAKACVDTRVAPSLPLPGLPS